MSVQVAQSDISSALEYAGNTDEVWPWHHGYMVALHFLYSKKGAALQHALVQGVDCFDRVFIAPFTSSSSCEGH
jgi:hypothetical protein